MKIKHIIFDFDGTLADSLKYFVDTYNELSDKYGYEKAKGEKFFRDHSTFGFLIKVMKVPFHRLLFYYLEAKKIFKKKILEAKAFPEIKDVLDELSKEYELGILTSNFENSVQDFIKDENIDDFKYVFSNASTFGKHRSLKRLLKEKEINKDEVIYIGDELRDIKACKRVGIKIIAVEWGFDSEKILEKGNPDFLVYDPREILEVIKEIY